MVISARHQAVQRAISDLRRGGAVLVRGRDNGAFLIRAAEQINKDTLTDMARLSRSAPYLLISTNRAMAIGLHPRDDAAACSIALSNEQDSDVVRGLIGDIPLNTDIDHLSILAEKPSSVAETILMLMRVARLLPAAICTHFPSTDHAALRLWADEHGVLIVPETDIRRFETISASLLKEVARARLPLADAEDAQIAIFRPGDGGTEHFAIIISNGDKMDAPPVRIHSQCITGDILGSLKCDCGDQLRQSIRQMAETGGGVLIYLAQEGRDIGLVNKLKAYALQDTGIDTVDANHHLGFETDHRFFLPAAEMLRQMGVTNIQLLTNNPDKISQIEACGITVSARLPLITPDNPYNADYLATKAKRTGHMLD
jgi:GTP cyclohydrolase II